MGYIPLGFELGGRKCLVVGGGMVATKKVEFLLNFQVNIVVISLDFTDRLKKYGRDLDGVELRKERFCENSLKEYGLVIVATNDRELDSRIYEMCIRDNILVNVVDNKEKCTVIIPSVIRRKDLTIAVSTDGRSPVMARIIRKDLERKLRMEHVDMIETLGDFREYVKKEFVEESVRKKWILLLAKDMENGNVPVNLSQDEWINWLRDKGAWK